MCQRARERDDGTHGPEVQVTHSHGVEVHEVEYADTDADEYLEEDTMKSSAR
jgi:hypothetical protein